MGRCVLVTRGVLAGRVSEGHGKVRAGGSDLSQQRPRSPIPGTMASAPWTVS